jgi:hypothetical protein
MSDREAASYWEHHAAWLRQLMPEHFAPAPPPTANQENPSCPDR